MNAVVKSARIFLLFSQTAYALVHKTTDGQKDRLTSQFDSISIEYRLNVPTERVNELKIKTFEFIDCFGQLVRARAIAKHSSHKLPLNSARQLYE